MTLRHELAIVLLLLLVAAPTRLLWLDVVPPGLFHDEAYEGIDAVRIAAGARPAFLPENYGREPLYAYLMAGLFKLAGPSVIALRATSAIFGTLCIPAAYFWARAHFGPMIGLVTAALATASYWMLQESRLGMRPIALPACLAFAAGLTWLAARQRRAWAWPLAGLCLGVAQYTYLPARLFPAVVLGEAAFGLWAGRCQRPIRTSLIGLAVLIAVAALVAAPLGYYFATNPEAATARGNVVSIFTSSEGQADPLGALGRNLAPNLGMFVWRGDDTLRHNLPERAVFDPLVAPFFLLGAGLSLRAALSGKVEHAALWLWLAVMLLPGLLSDSAPHFLRAIGLLPALFALPAQGLVAAGEWLARRLSERRARLKTRPLVMALVVGVIVLSQSMSLYDYFVRFPAWPGLAETFDAPRAELARVAGDPPADLDLTLPTPGWSYATIRFLRPKSFQPPEPPPAQPAQARFGSNVVLLGYDLEPAQPAPGQYARLTLYWRTLREMNASYVESARVIDAYGRVWWERDGVPGFGTLPTDTWVPGEFIADHLDLELNHGTPAGEYALEIALAQPDGGRRQAVFDAGGRPAGNTQRLTGLIVKDSR